MGKKLAIKGHPTRGNEVIELLEMMGGKNTYEYNGRYLIDEIVYTREVAYYIDFESQIRCIDIKDITTNFIVYSLEMFLKTFPFKVDDKVIDEADGCPGVVCEMKWDEDVSDMKYCVAFGNGVDFGWFVNDSINFLKIKKNENLEETQSNQDIDKVVDIFRKEFCECCGSQRCSVQDDELVYCERFKNLMDNSGKPSVKNHKMGPKSKLPSKYYEVSMEETQSKRECNELRMPLDDNENKFPSFEPMFKMNDELEYKIPDGYEITEVSKDTVFIKPIKSKYPTTYEECYDEGNTELHFIYVDKDERDLYESFIQLIRCRNAYWKIAGEEMGLGKPWKPDWNNGRTFYCIYNSENKIVKRFLCTENKILLFPTEELCDAFYKNFQKEIEQCKELL